MKGRMLLFDPKGVEEFIKTRRTSDTRQETSRDSQ